MIKIWLSKCGKGNSTTIKNVYYESANFIESCAGPSARLCHHWKFQLPVRAKYRGTIVNAIIYIYICIYMYVLPNGPFYKQLLRLIPAWIRNHIPVKCGMKLLIHFQNIIGCTVEVWEWIRVQFHPTLYNVNKYFFMLRCKYIHVCKRNPCVHFGYGS